MEMTANEISLRNRKDRRFRRRFGIGALLLAALALRLYGLGAAPKPLETLDEYHFLWSGLSLWTEGRPTSWSWIEGRLMPDIYLGTVQLDGNAFPMVRPALDHPPLYSLLAGGWAWLTGAEPRTMVNANGPEIRIWRVGLARTRLLSLALFAIAFILLYDLTARRFGYAAAVATLAIYGYTSHIVLHQRLLVTESLSAPLFLANLCAFERFRLGRWSERKFGAVTVILTAAALLTKLVAVCQAGAIAGLLALLAARRTGKRGGLKPAMRAVLWPALGVLSGLGIYLGYAAWQGWGLFWRMMALHGMRFEGFDSFVQIVVNDKLIHQIEPSAPLLYGWLALFAMAVQGANGRGRGRELFAAPLIYIAGFAFFATSSLIYGWHLLPFYPFLAMGLGVLFVKVWRSLDGVSYLVLAFLLIAAAFQFGFVLAPGFVAWLRVKYLFVMAIAVILPIFPGRMARRIQRGILALALFAMLAGEVRSVLVKSSVEPNPKAFLSNLK